MPNLSIKNVPEALAEQLRQRAAANHRSLQGELMAILEATLLSRNSTTGFTMTAMPLSNQKIAEARTPVEVEKHLQAIANRQTHDGLLDKLDAIVAGSAWGNATLLSREQANQRGQE